MLREILTHKLRVLIPGLSDKHIIFVYNQATRFGSAGQKAAAFRFLNQIHYRFPSAKRIHFHRIGIIVFLRSRCGGLYYYIPVFTDFFNSPDISPPQENL